jgi:hypothetical protein
MPVQYNENDTEIEEIRVFTGSSDDLIRGYKVLFKSITTVETNKNSVGDVNELNNDQNVSLEYYGCISRSNSSIDKCVALRINNAGNILAAQSSGKVIEVSQFFNVLFFSCI